MAGIASGCTTIIRFFLEAALLFHAAPSYALDNDPLENMDLGIATEKDTGANAVGRISVGGYLESRNQFREGKANEPVSLRQRVWLDGYLDCGRIRGFASGYADYDPAVQDWSDDSSEQYDLKLNEAYLTFDTELVDVILGKKMMRWGTGDGINPMDLINPRDCRDPIASARTDARIPILLANVICLLGPVTIEGAFIPKAEVNEFPAPGSPWEPNNLKNLRKSASTGEIALSPGQTPDDWGEDGELAIRTSTVWKRFDLALLYFNGYPDDPAYRRDLLSDGRLRFTPHYGRYQAFGFNFAKSTGRATIRGEIAVKPDLPFSIDPNDPSYEEDNDGLVSRDLYQSLIGVDRQFFTNLYLNLQFFVDHIEGGREALAVEQVSHGLTFEISNKFLDDDLTGGVRGTHYTSNEGSVIEFFAEYNLGDNWEIAPGYMFFEGPKASRLGQHSENDMFYLRVRYVF